MHRGRDPANLGELGDIGLVAIGVTGEMADFAAPR